MSKTLIVNGVQYVLDTNKTLLENLEKNALKIEFHCREGHCGACKCKLTSGTLTYKETPLAYLRNNEILPCCGFSDNDIEITTD